MSVVTRIPPSPTGRLHIGTVRTALFNYLYARNQGGKFLIRSEDTDRARSKKEYEEEIIEGLTWLGFEHDGYSRQSENAPRHAELLAKVIAEGKAYVSSEASKDEEGKMVEVVRLKNPGTSVTFDDLVHGPITFDTTELGDFVIARRVDDPLYHFAVVVDDWDAGVTHVIRGDDHISNTPRQILIQEALGAPRPVYAHLPLILDEKRAKLSKRNAVTSLVEYREEGFLPEAIVNYLALLGWSAGDDREDYSLEELVEAFTIEGVHKSGAVFDRTKFLSVNQRWMRKLSDEEFIVQGNLTTSDPEKLRKAVPLLKERAQTFGEARAMLAGELRCLFETPSLDKERLLAKEVDGGTREHLMQIMELIVTKPSAAPSPEEAKALIMPYADEEESKHKGGRGAVLWPLRYALSGEEKSPDPFTLISILGTKEAALRLETALGIL